MGIGKDEFIGRVQHLERLKVIDVVRLHGFVANLQTQRSVRIRLRSKPVDITGFEQRNNAAREQFRFFNRAVRGVDRWA